MEPDARLSLTALTVYNKPLTEPVDVFLSNQTLAQKLRATAPRTPATITGLYPFPNGMYRIEVGAPCYHTVIQFVSIPPNGEGTAEITLPVDARRVKYIAPPPYENLSADAQRLLAQSDKVLNFEGKTGAALYNALDDIRRAGFLNLIAKATRTTFTNNRTVLSYVTELVELRGDRFFGTTARDLRSETTNAAAAGDFNEVDELLHDPPPGYVRDRSFKTLDHYGNLQLSFFASAAGDYMVDMDIDDAQGFEHIFQVLGNALTGQPTNPYNIHEILLAAQHLDPGYDLVLQEAAATA